MHTGSWQRVRLRGSAVAILGGLVVIQAGCGANAAGSGGSGSEARLQVVTTVSPITSIAANVIGDKADITGVVPEGTNSHTFEPPPSAAAVLSKADVVFINGLRLEDPTRELAEENKNDDAEIVELGTMVLPESQWIYDFSLSVRGPPVNEGPVE